MQASIAEGGAWLPGETDGAEKGKFPAPEDDLSLITVLRITVLLVLASHLHRIDRHVQADAVARLAVHEGGVGVAAVVVGHVVAGGALLDRIDVAATLHGLLLRLRRVGIVLVVDIVTNHRTGNTAGSRG